jgi:hypothetical protein
VKPPPETALNLEAASGEQIKRRHNSPTATPTGTVCFAGSGLLSPISKKVSK